MPGSVAALLEPRSVAVVGASNDPLKRGHQALRALLESGFDRPVYPVNPREAEILGHRAYPTVGAIEAAVDLALITTPAAAVPGLLRECGAHGVAVAVVVAVGFGEAGDEGRAHRLVLERAAEEAGIRLLGPNTNGALNLAAGLNLVGARGVPSGSVALLCQSGNMALSLFSEATHQGGIGFSSYVGIGNEAGLRYHEFLDHFRDDPATEAVLIYAEGFRDGRQLLASAARLGRDKPVICYKAGSSEVGRRSALSHTGAVAGSPRVSEMLLRQAGVTVVERSDELLAVCGAVLRQPPLASRRVAVLTDGGGHGTVAADALTQLGLELPGLGEATRRRLEEALPPAASTRNPVDVAGATDRDPQVFVPTLEALLQDRAIDGVLCVGLLGGYGIRFSDRLAEVEVEAARTMARLASEAGKPLVVQSAYAPARPRAHAVLREAGVPVHGSVETAARALAALAERGRFLATAAQRSAFPAASARSGGTPRPLTEPAGRALLARHGIPSGRWAHAVDADSAARAVEELGGPVAIKVVSPDVTHKSDAGGVLLDVDSPAEARHAYGEIVRAVRDVHPDARIEGVLVTPMAPAGVELMIGASNDPAFGPVLAAGAGGTAVELLDDVAFRAAPVTALECEEMLDELRCAPLLDGFRGAGPVDRAHVVDLLLAVSGLVATEPGVLELDLNPLIAHPVGVALVDVRVVVAGDGPLTVGAVGVADGEAEGDGDDVLGSSDADRTAIGEARGSEAQRSAQRDTAHATPKQARRTTSTRGGHRS